MKISLALIGLRYLGANYFRVFTTA